MSASGAISVFKRTYAMQLSIVAMYAFVYGALLMLTPFVALTYNNIFGEALYLLLFVGFAAIFVEGLALKELTLKTPWMKLYLCFFVVMIITTAVNYRYGITGNFKAAVFQLVSFSSCSLIAPLLGSKDCLKGFVRRLYRVLVVIWTIACFVSLVEFVVQYSDFVEFSLTNIRRQGFTDGRLFGVFQDPNFGAVTVVLLYVIAFYYYSIGEIKHGKALTAALLVCLLYLVGSASRTADLCVVACALVGVFALRYRIKHSSEKEKRRLLIRDSIQLSVSALTVIIVLGLAAPLYASFIRNTFDLPWASQGALMRTDMRIDNLSNNRFTIWTSYIECSDPVTAVIGRGYRTYRDEVIDQYPDSYIAIKKYEAHNAFILLYESTGLVGIVLWGGFAVFLLRKAIGKARKAGGLPLDVICALCILAIEIIMGCFFTSLWFVNDFYTYLFASLIGYLCWRLGLDGFADERSLDKG